MYPNDEIWRINLPFAFLVVSIIAYRLLNEKYKKYLFLFLVIPFPILSLMLFSGGSLGLMPVDTREWGGLFLTLVISIFAIIFCFPLGVLLAMGRRSNLPVVRYFSIGFIEFWRGVPLITFIALFKDTPLVFVVGLLEILGMVNLAKTNPAWLGMATEGYVFVALVYWIFCFAMSRYSLSIEEKLKTTH